MFLLTEEVVSDSGEICYLSASKNGCDIYHDCTVLQL